MEPAAIFARHISMKLIRISALVLTGAVAVALTACEPKDEAGDGSSSNADDSASSDEGKDKDDDAGTQNDSGGQVGDIKSITLTKSGGISGMEETLEVGAEGKWEYVKARMAPKKGDLSGSEHEKLIKLVTDKDIAAVDKKSDKQCNDMQTYTLTLVPAKGKKVDVTTDDCGVSPNSMFDDAIKLLGEATPI